MGALSNPVAIVLHTMGGSLVGTDGWFQNPSSQVSAHYGVGLGGQVHQYVQLADAAYANGILEPGNIWVPKFGSAWPNGKTVSIETEDSGSGQTEVTDAMFAATLAVCRLILQTYPGIKTLSGHKAISPSSRANCPGARWVASGRFAALAGELGLETLI